MMRLLRQARRLSVAPIRTIRKGKQKQANIELAVD